MRKPRIKIHGRSAVYHCISRIVGGQWLLEEQERPILRNFMFRQAKFCGIIIVTYSILINHFHVTARVPVQGELSDQQILARCEEFYGPDHALVQRLRNRSFIDAVAIGSRDFVEGIFQEFRSHFGPRRKTGGRSLKKLGLPELYALRDLKVNAVGIAEIQKEGESEEKGESQD